MKIRNGFVSNSSSSSFVVMLKKDIQHDLKEKIRSYLKQEFGYFDKEEEIVDKFYSKIGSAISGVREIFEGEADDCIEEIDAREFEVIRDFCESYGIVLAEIDTSSDCGVIKILNVNDYENIRKFMEA